MSTSSHVYDLGMPSEIGTMRNGAKVVTFLSSLLCFLALGPTGSAHAELVSDSDTPATQKQRKVWLLSKVTDNEDVIVRSDIGDLCFDENVCLITIC